MKTRFSRGDFLRFTRRVDKEESSPYYCIVIDSFDEWMNVYWFICAKETPFYQVVEYDGFYGVYEKVA